MQLTPYQNLKTLIKDGIVWKAERLKHNAGTSDAATSKAINDVCQTLSLISDEYIRTRKIEEISKIFNYKIAPFRKLVDAYIKNKETVDEDETHRWHWKPYMTKEHQKEILSNGFSQVYVPGNSRHTGIHIGMGEYKVKVISNCTIEPLFLIKCSDPTENKQLFRVRNYKTESIIEFSRTSLINSERFSAGLIAGHNFAFSGTSDHLKMIMPIINDDVKECQELSIFGWQPEGFFAYTDKFYSDGKLNELSKLGIGEHAGEHYFSPSRSILYRNIRKDNDKYKGRSALNYKKSPITFEQWCRLMEDTYHGYARIAVSFALMAMFRDIVVQKDGSCPHLYSWGAPESGKSKINESLNYLFFSEPRKMNMNSGTEYAYMNYMETFRNCISFLNEVDDTSVDPKRMQSLKAAFDDEGRPKGSGKKGQVEVMKFNSAITMAGQKLVDSDNNAMPMRCIVMEFRSEEKKQRAPEQVKAYDILKRYEAQGGFNSVLTEILPHREYVEQEFDNTFNEIFASARVFITENNYRWHERIARNHCYVLTFAKLFEPKFDLPWKYETMFPEMMKAIHDLAERITGTDSSSHFWQVIMSLVDQRELVNGFHFKIKGVKEWTFEDGRKVEFVKETQILMLRFDLAHSAYLKEVRRQSSREGINKQSLLSYLKSKEYFFGSDPSEWFIGVVRGERKKQNSSSYLFNYDILEKAGVNLNLEVERVYERAKESSSEEAPRGDTAPSDLPF